MLNRLASLFAIFAGFALVGHAQNLPQGWGPLVIETNSKCTNISGRYDSIGIVMPDSRGHVGTLSYVLQAGLPAVDYRPGIEKYTILDSQDDDLNISVVIGDASRDTKYKVECSGGWVTLKREGSINAEGTNVRSSSIVKLAKNIDGSLVVSDGQAIESRSFFGLARSNRQEHRWLLFRKYEGQSK